MVRAHTLRLLITALALASAVLPARALQLGESQAQILERHGVPGAEDRAKNVAIYFWDGWSAEVEYKEEAIGKLIYRRNAYLEPSEVTGLLQSNGGTARWREVTPNGDATRQWVRDDGATATCLAVRPLMMTLQVGQRHLQPAPRYGGQGAPKVVTPSAPPVVSTTPPSFPKLLGSTPENVAEPATTAPATVATPLTPLRSLSKLPSEEAVANPAVVPEKAAETAPKPKLGRHTLATGGDGTEDRQEEPVHRPPNIPPGSPSSDNSSLLWLVALLGVIGGGAVYWFKFRPKKEGSVSLVRETAPRVSAPRQETVLSMPSLLRTNPAVDALRSDQFELVVGEIFRREGYAVELSAAAAQGDSIDLTLRRDSETILVQCKYWKSSRVTEREVGEFYSAMMANGAPRGIFVTAGCFSREAQQFAVGKEIDLMDRTALEECIAAVARSGEDFCAITPWIEEFAAHARIFDPECPICQGSMVIRHHPTNRTASWNCRNHPRCPGRRDPRRDLLAVAAVH